MSTRVLTRVVPRFRVGVCEIWLEMRPDLGIRIPAEDEEPGSSSRPVLRSSTSMSGCSSTASEGRVVRRADLVSGPLTAGSLDLRFEYSFVSDLEARCAQAKQHTNQQLSQLLSLPEMRSEGSALTDEQRQALLALRQLAVTFIEHADHATAGLMCQQLMRSAHELRLPLTGVGDDGINLTTRFVLALTPCARLQPVQHLLSVTDGGLEGAAEDGAENEGGEAEAVLQRFYQRWEQSGAAWSHRMIQRRHSAAALPFVGLSKSLPADSVRVTPFGANPRSSFALGSPLASSFVGFPFSPVARPATPSVTPKLPRRRQSAPGAETLPIALREASGAPSHPAASLPELTEQSRAPVAVLSSPLDRASLEAHPRSSPSENTIDLQASVSSKPTGPPTTASPRGTRRSTIAAAPLLLCRICEGMVDADQLEQHSKQCVLEVVVFTAEQRLEKLKDLLTREIEHCATQGSAGARQAALLHLLLQACVEALSFESLDESRSTEMLRDARELHNESHRLADPLLISLAGQLHAVLDQLQPFWREEHHGTLHRNQSLTQAAEAVSISSFEILKPISRGAYGRVVLAAKRTTKDLFAIKVVRKRDMRRKNQVHRIKVEREVMAEANHPFLVKLFYSFQTAEKLFMVMEVSREATVHARTQRAQPPVGASCPQPPPSSAAVCQRR